MREEGDRGARLRVTGGKRCRHGKRKGSCVDCSGCAHGKLKHNCARRRAEGRHEHGEEEKEVRARQGEIQLRGLQTLPAWQGEI